jgi:hypothetical protein
VGKKNMGEIIICLVPVTREHVGHLVLASWETLAVFPDVRCHETQCMGSCNFDSNGGLDLMDVLFEIHLPCPTFQGGNVRHGYGAVAGLEVSCQDVDPGGDDAGKVLKEIV